MLLFADNLIKKDDLKDLLECPVCLRVPRSSPIFQVVSQTYLMIKLVKKYLSVCPRSRGLLRVSTKRVHVSSVSGSSGQHPVSYLREDAGEASKCLQVHRPGLSGMTQFNLIFLDYLATNLTLISFRY